MLAVLATLIVYVGFGFISEFKIGAVGFIKNEYLGITLLIVSNVLWIIHFYITHDYAAILWQGGFLIINTKWLIRKD